MNLMAVFPIKEVLCHVSVKDDMRYSDLLK
mgnify:CR=1 FL=1